MIINTTYFRKYVRHFCVSIYQQTRQPLTFSPLSDGKQKVKTVRNEIPMHGMMILTVQNNVFLLIVMLNVMSKYGSSQHVQNFSFLERIILIFSTIKILQKQIFTLLLELPKYPILLTYKIPTSLHQHQRYCCLPFRPYAVDLPKINQI